MPKQKNITVAAELKEKVSKAKSLILTDYRGLTHKQSEELHRAVKKQGGEFVVVKNSLLKIASGNIETTGPTAVLFAYQDEIAPLKELAKLIKTTSLPKLKFGFIGAVGYDDKQLDTIAKLPSQDILQGQVVGHLASPIHGLLYTLNGNLQKLVYALGVIRDGKNN